MKLYNAWPLALVLAALAPVAGASSAPRDNDQPETIDGVAIRAGIERLSYISLRYFGVRTSYDACTAQMQGVVPKQQECAEAELAYQDIRLNRAYKILLADLDELDKRAAVEAQRAWLVFRDKDCAARAGRFGSNAGPATKSTCLMESTAHRAQELEDWQTSLTAFAKRNFAGHWLYTQSCGYEHSIDLYLTQTGSTVSGRWSEGTRISGSFGSLQGHINSGLLSVQYCEGDDRAGYTKCPTYDPNSTDHFVLHGNELLRYRGSGPGADRRFEKDVVLHRAINGQPIVSDPHCPDSDD
jgi:uncharacterized protein YecT (DUF1311 family)